MLVKAVDTAPVSFPDFTYSRLCSHFNVHNALHTGKESRLKTNAMRSPTKSLRPKEKDDPLYIPIKTSSHILDQIGKFYNYKT